MNDLPVCFVVRALRAPAGVKLMIHTTDAQDAQKGAMWAAIEIKQLIK